MKLWPVLVLAALAALWIGPLSIGPGRLWPALIGEDATARVVLVNIRLPRILAAALVGAGLASAGAAYQTAFRNPLVSPDLLGVSAGAGFGAILGLFLGLPVWEVQALSFASGLAVVALVLTVTRAMGLTEEPLALILTGVALGSVAGAGISLLKILADPENQLPAMTFWLLGSLAGARLSDLPLLALPVAVGLAGLTALRWRITALSLGEEEATALGLNARALRLGVILAATLVTSASVAIVGMVGWVGLMAPHLARLVVGARFDRLLPAAALTGASLMLAIDTAARSVALTEIPLGILTALVGAPVFLGLLAVRRWS